MSQNTAIPLNKLIAWQGNVRKTESDKGIDELAASIRAHGLLQSLIVRKDRDDNLDIGQWYQPTAENYFGRIAKPAIIEALIDAKVPITPAMEKARKGDLALIAEREIRRSGWLPELLRKPK